MPRVGPADLAEQRAVLFHTDGKCQLDLEPACSIYDPGTNNQTINNIILVTPNDTLVDLFNEIDAGADGTASSHLKAIMSTDHGTTWSATPVSVAECSAWVRQPNGGNVRDSVLLFSATLGPTGTIYVAWQDARSLQRRPRWYCPELLERQRRDLVSPGRGKW